MIDVNIPPAAKALDMLTRVEKRPAPRPLVPLLPPWGKRRLDRVRASGGYVYVLVAHADPMSVMSTHPTGYVLEHRLVMARFLGRPLDRRETVHHIDGDRANNSLENLQLRRGQHGKGQALRCRSCGSQDLIHVELD